MIWNLDSPEAVIKNPVRTISHHTDVVLSMSFNTDGSRLATSCKDKKIRVLEPRTGNLLQVCTGGAAGFVCLSVVVCKYSIFLS